MIEDVVNNYEEYVLGRETGEALIDKLSVQTNQDVDHLSQEVLAGLVQSVFNCIYQRFGEDEAEEFIKVHQETVSLNYVQQTSQ